MVKSTRPWEATARVQLFLPLTRPPLVHYHHLLTRRALLQQSPHPFCHFAVYYPPTDKAETKILRCFKTQLNVNPHAFSVGHLFQQAPLHTTNPLTLPPKGLP